MSGPQRTAPTVRENRARSLAGQLAGQAMTAQFSQFPEQAVAKAKICLLDYLSCALESLNLPWAIQAAGLAAPARPGAALIGRAGSFVAADAAFANAVAGHGLVREDMHTGSIAHLGVVVWPTLLAIAQRERASGEALLAAAIVGYETGGRLGRAIMTTELARLFRPTGLVGAAAAAMAAAHLCRLPADTALNAFSLGINAAAGLNEWPHTGGSEMYFHPGTAARNGLVASDLARLGAVASPTILEGEAGFFAAFARRPLSKPVQLFPGGQIEILSVFNKEVPACNFAQTPCQAALRARGAATGSEIVAVELAVSEAALRYPGCSAAGPFDYPLQAKMSILFGVAATLTHGEIAEGNYSDLDNPEISRLIAATRIHADPAYSAAFPGRQGARVKLSLADGSVKQAELADVVPASPELIRRRFAEVAGAVLGEGAARRLAEMVDDLENEADASRLDALCALAARQSPSMPAASSIRAQS